MYTVSDCNNIKASLKIINSHSPTATTFLFSFDGNKTVPVRLCTSWYTFDPAESINHVPGMLTKAVDAGHIMNMTMFFDYIPFTKNETEHFNAGTEWEIGLFNKRFG